MSRYKADQPLSQATHQIPPPPSDCFKACAQHWCCLVRAPSGRGGHCVAALAPLLPTHLIQLSAKFTILSAILRISRSSSHTRKKRSSLASSSTTAPACDGDGPTVAICVAGNARTFREAAVHGSYKPNLADAFGGKRTVLFAFLKQRALAEPDDPELGRRTVWETHPAQAQCFAITLAVVCVMLVLCGITSITQYSGIDESIQTEWATEDFRQIRRDYLSHTDAADELRGRALEIILGYFSLLLFMAEVGVLVLSDFWTVFRRVLIVYADSILC